MDFLEINTLLNRNSIVKEIEEFLNNFEKNKYNVLIKRGIYIYGPPGSGKTFFIKQILKELNYDIISYDSGEIRNKCIIENITQNNITDTNVLSLLTKNHKKIALLMDEIDGMNSGDKGGINSLIKLIRPKKTKKQKLEEITKIPVICIGNFHIDKKINELIKVCNSIILHSPSDSQICSILKTYIPNIPECNINKFVNYIQNDLRKFFNIYNLYIKDNSIFTNSNFIDLLIPKSYNEDSKIITKKFLNEKINIKDHINFMNETDRTIVGLLWHENIIDILQKNKSSISIKLYLKLLNNLCFADYIDRITFQKQIWQFNEMSSLIKILYNNCILHSNFSKINIKDIRFTKVLTKYSTEYNNSIFIQNLCTILNMDKKDLYSFFIQIKPLHNSGEIYNILQDYNINKLEINRMYRYLEKFENDESSEIEI